jgi:putative ATP-dependent endonuclease of OLD family
MYLKELRLSNFRKYERLTVEFKNGLNVLIGENDSGKTAIIDAIRYLLNTKSFESVRFESRDFYQNDSSIRADNLSIIGVFSGFTDAEAANFLEWGYFNTKNDFELRLLLKVNIQSSNRIIWDLKAGPENAETQMDGNARELLQVTYLKPLRDAETELTPGYRSRLAQILQSHKDFQKTKNEIGQTEPHELERIIEEANTKIHSYLSEIKTAAKDNSDNSNNIISQINTYVNSFTHHDDKRSASIKIADPELSKILRSLGLELEDNSSGLGTLNKLFMAAELLHLKTDPYNSIRLCLIEELEAHLHPQAQLRVINTLQKLSNDKKTQFILTTHSTTIGSSIDLQNIILCKNGVFPMWKGQTKLAIGDYKFLQRFLDSTKANLFFAKGVIMVEGDAENILIPTIAELIGMPLHEYGVSIVNVNSTAFLRYANIFIRAKGKELEIPVSVITDLDVRALEYYEDLSNEAKPPTYHKIGDSLLSDAEHCIKKLHGNIYSNKDELNDAIKEHLEVTRMPPGMNNIIKNWPKEILSISNIDDVRLAKKKTIESKFSSHVKGFLNNKWTLEYDLALSVELREYFAQAVEIAKKVKSSESYFHKLYDNQDNFNLPRVDDGDESIESLAKSKCSNGTKFEIAYDIFKPFVSSNKPSKAVTAQVFSEIIIKNKEVLKGIIKTDPSLKYITDAIEHACGVGGDNGKI